MARVPVSSILLSGRLRYLRIRHFVELHIWESVNCSGEGQSAQYTLVGVEELGCFKNVIRKGGDREGIIFINLNLII